MSPPEVTPVPLLSWRRVFVLMVCWDVTMVLAGLVLAHEVRYYEGLDTPFVHSAPALPMVYIVPMAVVWLVTLRAFGIYERANLVSGIGEYRRIVSAGLVTTLAVIVFAYVRVNPYIARGFLLASLVTVVTLVGCGRFAMRRYIYSQARRGLPLDRVVVVGTNRHAISVAQQLVDSPSSSAAVVGFLSEYMPKGTVVLGARRVLGEPMELARIAERHGVTRALVVESGLSWESLQAMVRLMHSRRAVAISLLPSLFDLHATQMVPHQLGPVLALTPLPARIVGVDAVMKRALDLLLCTFAVLVSAPFMVIMAVASIGSGRGVGLVPERVVGTRGPFTMWNFRGPSWAVERHLARLPNLVFVLRGSMSLLGPRPVALSRAPEYAEAMQFLELAKPGFIGPWWLVGKSRPEGVAEELAYDLHYLRNYSIWYDLHILFQVAQALLGGANGRIGLGASRTAPGSPVQQRSEP
jgi:lipopolysaccharide/colanic/teichoic acid biosynthesis glycosyltransferase